VKNTISILFSFLVLTTVFSEYIGCIESTGIIESIEFEEVEELLNDKGPSIQNQKFNGFDGNSSYDSILQGSWVSDIFSLRIHVFNRGLRQLQFSPRIYILFCSLKVCP